MIKRHFLLIYALLLIFELFCSSVNFLLPFHIISKPLLVSSLIIFFYLNSKHLKTEIIKWTLLALLFSLLGDLLLMFVDQSATFFISGLLAFLGAHLCYISIFLKLRNRKIFPFIPVIILVSYAASFFYFLSDTLGEMLVPVGIYMVVILIMAISSFLRKEMTSSLSYILVVIGAVFFLISDSLIALNKFYQPMIYSNISIMTSYAIAQYLIVLGILNQEKRTIS